MIDGKSRFGGRRGTAGLIVAALLACAAMPSEARPTAAATVANTAAATAAATVAVSIKNMTFTPASVTVKVGDTVTWTNDDDRDHTVRSGDGAPAAFDSGNLSPGKSYSFTFRKAGTYPYGCALHSRMRGTVVVQAE